MKRRNRIIAVLVAIVVIAIFVFFRDRQKAEKEEDFNKDIAAIMEQAMPKECTSEISKFCSDIPIAQVRDCLKKNSKNLSEPCNKILK